MLRTLLFCIGKLIMKQFFNDLATAFSNCFKNCCVSYKLAQMRFPDNDTAFIETETENMAEKMQEFFNAETNGVTVLWAPRGCGKTHSLCHLRPKHTLYWDCRRFPEFERLFFQRVGLDYELDKDLLHDFCKCQKYSTIVLDHFEKITDDRFLDYMSKDFRILCVCHTLDCAERILQLDLCPRAKILEVDKKQSVDALSQITLEVHAVPKPTSDFSVLCNVRKTQEWEKGKQLREMYNQETIQPSVRLILGFQHALKSD